MDFEDPSLGKELTSKSGESEEVQKKWRQEMLDVASMNTLGSEEKEKQQQVNPEHIRSPTLEQQFNTLRAVSQNEGVQYAPEKQNSLKHPSTYVQRHSLSFPQHNVHQQRIVHNTKAHHSLEGHVYQFHTHLPVASDDMFFQIYGHGAGFSRKKFTGITSTYSQFPQKCMEPSDDAYKKEQKPKKPGKYICPYCTRACAKPSVLKKHIRSHTGERPYPCIPCGFSFKTKSNLYKHRKSHAHAIKAGLVPFSDSTVSKLELDASCIDVETEIHSDGEQSTDTDEETLLLAEDSQKLSPNPQIPLNVNVRSEDYLDAAVQASSDDSSGGLMKVPILIIPKGGIQTPSEAVHLMESELMYNPSLSGKTDDSHTVRQKLALRLTEKKVQDSEKSLNLLSPHSKGSTDSGYFSRSESAEQQICSPNANATSYEEIIFGKYGRLSPRSSMPNPEASFLVVNPAMIEEHVSHLITKREGLVEHGKFKSMKYRLSGIHTFEQHKSHLITDPVEPNTKRYPECQHDQAVLLAAPADTSPLIRSNSMPSYGTNLSIPPSIRGSHSFDEQVTGTDDVFYSGSVGVTHQKLLKRQGAFELPSVLESHSDFDSYARMSKTLTAVFNSKTMHDKPLTKEKKTSSLERVVYDVSGVPLKICDELEVQKQQIVKAGGDNVTEMMAPLQSRFGTMVENRKRRKEKSVGDEEDNPMSCSGIVSPVISDFDNKHGATRSGIVVQGQEYPYCVPPERFDICRLYTQLGSPLPVLDETASGTDLDKMVDLNNKTPGNVISVIQHTNSLSRPNSFDKSESTELFAYQQDKTFSPFETSDSGNTMCSMSSDWAQLTDNSVATSQPSQQSLQSACHRLVRQHNITVPEIRVTEEPDKPEKEPVIPVKEPEKPPEEFQWPQRSETLSQLPAEKLPPKKKRLRLADLDNSSGESSFESTGTSLSRSPSQESNLSHSSSLSMSFEREELVKSTTPTKQEELGRQSEFLTVPPGSCSLSISSHHQKEMRRSSSEQIPCPIPTETPEIRSKSFDYGNLIHSSEMESNTATLSPARERKKCFLVRQASFSGFPENMQADQELIGYQEPSDQMSITRISPLGWYHLPSSTLSGLASLLTENSGNIIVGTSAPLTSPLSHYSQQTVSSHNALKDPLAHQSHISRRHVSEPQHPENMFYPVLQNAVHLPFTSVCMNSLPSHHLLSWPNSADQLQRHFQPNLPLQKSYLKPSNQSELHPTYYLEAAHKHAEHKQVSYSHGTENVYQPYLETSAQTSKNMLVKVQRNHSGGSSDSDQHLQIVTASANSISLQPMPGTFVPVRIQTHVPSYGSVMYTSISQIAVTHTSTICKEYGSTSQSILATTASMRNLGFNIAQMLAPCGELEQYPLWKMPQTLALDLESAIPLCLASSSDSTSGGGKRVLSPASSLELFIETKQQKRDKDENMYGQIVKELSAVELTSSDIKKTLCRTSKPQLVRQGCTTEQKSGLSSASPPLLPLSSGKELPEPKGSDSLECQMSPDELYEEDTSSDMSLSPQRTPGEGHPNSNKPKRGTLKQMSDSSSITEGASYNTVKGCTERYCLQFPSLRTTTTVSWCFLNYSKPNHIEQESMKSSVYASWCTSSCNPNPSGLNTRTSLALLRSKQENSVAIYTIAAFQKSGADKLTSSSMWKLQFSQVKPESYLLVSSKLEKTATGSNKERSKGELHGEKESTSKHTEPMRIKIFEGGFKSNEEYVYVRGRGRGKYICEECGIRCKKPSMLKKHIRTHTDVRPYVCKLCNFAFKTKGNLTKHMKSKAHMKKCLELGVAMSSIDDVETEESGNIEDIQRESEKGIAATDHQFSDAEESDVDDAEEDEDDDEEDFDDTHGDSTPKTRSRSTSPQPPRFSTQLVTVASACHRASPDGSIGHSFITSYLSTLPSIQVTNLMKQSTTLRDSQMVEYPTLSFSLESDRDKIDVHDGIDEDYMLTSAPSSSSKDLSSCSRLSSPGYDPSPCRDISPKKYLSLRGDLSPRRHLSPRRDASPMKHLSPRKEAALRRELSPGRDVSPRQNISPLRPMSPGKDIISGRDLSPRREKRYMASFRALSPRRRLHRNTSLPSSHYLHSDPELLGHGNLRKSWTQVPYTGLSTEDIPEHQSMTPDGHSDYIFSHLPLHSQQQIRAPLPMIPIGGIQMIHSISTIQPGPPPSATKSLNPRSPEKGNIASESCKILHHEKHFSSKDPSRDPLSRAAWTISNAAARQGFKPTEGEQEENIHTCTKAIACLRIATEEGLSLNQDQLSTEPNKKKSLRAQLGIRHFTEPEVCPSTTHVDLHIEKDNLNT